MLARKLGHISQIGIVVRDLDRIIKKMRDIFGVEPRLVKLPTKGLKTQGKDAEFDANLAFYNFANIEIEFVQPIGGQSIWRDFLDDGQAGLHHIRFSVENFDEVVDAMKKKNINLHSEGESTRNIPGLRWGYFDTGHELDFVIEIFNEFEICD